MEKDFEKLSKRERQIMDIILSLEKASVHDVIKGMDDAPSYSSVRTIMNILVTKEYLKTEKDGNKYFYTPVAAIKDAQNSALDRILNTFFRGSVEDTVAALVRRENKNLNDEDIERIKRMIDKAARGGNDE